MREGERYDYPSDERQATAKHDNSDETNKKDYRAWAWLCTEMVRLKNGNQAWPELGDARPRKKGENQAGCRHFGAASRHIQNT